MPANQDVTQYAIAQVDRQQERIAVGLEALAVEVRRRTVRPRKYGHAASNAAASIVHAVQTGVANLPLDLLIEAAAEVDAAFSGMRDSDA